MDADRLKEILENHRKWLLCEDGGSRADLSRANLSRANLSRANLSGADLSRADLSRANLSRANLSGADLSRADLSGANLFRANLFGADLSGADLSGADLFGAHLSGADLSRADLSGANLYGAEGATLVSAMTEILPREGEVIGWKKCINNVLVKVRIPPTARRSNGNGRKCRAEFVEVLDVIGADIGIGIYDGETKYIKGQTVRCHEWCTDRFRECAGGIHFFLTKEEAEAYEP